jgi:hypothetical protein
MEHSAHNNSTIHIHSVAPTSVWSYWPIAAVYVVSASLAIYSVQWHAYPDYMSQVMGFVLVLFGIIKLPDIAGFTSGFSQYDPLAKRSVIYAQTYPCIEIGLGILFILQLLMIPATLVTLFIYSASLYGAVLSQRKKEQLHCVCMGTYFKLPLSTVTTIEASFMIVMCIWMLLMINTMTTMVM